MIFLHRNRRLAWAADIARAQDEVRRLVPQLSARDAAVVLGELDQIVAIPCPGRGIAGWFAMGDFLKEMERFDWFIRAVKAGAVPELLRVSPSEPFCGRLHRQVF